MILGVIVSLLLTIYLLLGLRRRGQNKRKAITVAQDDLKLWDKYEDAEDSEETGFGDIGDRREGMCPSSGSSKLTPAPWQWMTSISVSKCFLQCFWKDISRHRQTDGCSSWTRKDSPQPTPS